MTFLYGSKYGNTYNDIASAQHYSNRYQKAWFEVLQVSPDASKIIVDAAYKALAKVRHPDAGGTEEAMKELNQTYDSVRLRLK